MNQLDLVYRPRALTQPGCIEAILEFLGISATPEWLWGGSGIALFMNVADDLCPSAHHSHGYNMNQRGKNVGYDWEQHLTFSNRDDYREKRAGAWEASREAIDAGHPGLLWHWEWHVVRGYDEAGYSLSGKIQDHLPWQELGSAVGWMELVVIRPGTPADDRAIVKEAFQVAVGCWDAPDQWGATGVPKGYERWLAALEAQVNPWGAADMPAVYGACRAFAAGFLAEAQARLDGSAAEALGAALPHYQRTAESLAKAAEALPRLSHEYGDPEVEDTDDEQRQAVDAEIAANLADDDRRNAAIQAVTAARDAEAAGVEHLRAALAEL